MDSSSVFGAVGHSAIKGPEPLGSVQFFPSQLQALPTLHPSGVILKFLPHSHWLQQQSGDTRDVAESNRSSSHSYGQGVDLKVRQGILIGNSTAHSSPHTPEVSFFTSSSLQPALHRSSPVHPALPPSPHPHPFHQPSPHPPPQTSSHFEPGQDRTPPYMVSQEVRNGPLTHSYSKNAAPPIYTGTPFPSMLHSARGQRGGHYTPRPTLNPLRRGSGLYSSLSSVHHRERGMGRGGEEEEGGGLIPCINVGADFQAELPPCSLKWEESGAWPAEEESPREQLLWKPWEELEESVVLREQVERLLLVCSSSCLPGGGSNTELALHCLHSCHGDTLATLEVLLLSPSSPAGDYHYSGSDVWTSSEKGLFSKALAAHSKDFSLIHKMVRSKSVCQCVEFYYVRKKLQEKQRKQQEEEEERERDGGMEQQTRVVPVPQSINRQFGLEGAVPIPSLASFFPCKLCGKMFYKIKSRNAHMKIHRQPQEDWSERRLQHHLLTQRLALSLPHNLTPNLGSGLLQPQASALAYPYSGQLPASSNNSHTGSVLNSISVTNGNSVALSNTSIPTHAVVVTHGNVIIPNHSVITNSDSNDSGPNQRGPASIVPFHQSWSSFGLNSDPATFYCDPEVKDPLGVTAGSKGPIVWQ